MNSVFVNKINELEIISPVCVKLHVGISPGIFLLFCMAVQRWLFVVTRYLTYTFGPISITFN